MKKSWKLLTLCGVLLGALAGACIDDDDELTSDAGPGTGGSQAAGKGGTGAGGQGGSGSQSLCEKYGGKAAVGKVVAEKVIPAIAGDCRISPFFTSLPTDRLTRVVDCLSIQVEALFGCAGVQYAGSKASNGLACRPMAEIHDGLAISTGDFDALLEDVVAGLSEAGVDSRDIAAAAPALVGLKSDIVEDEAATEPSAPAPMCDGDADAGVDAGAQP